MNAAKRLDFLLHEPSTSNERIIPETSTERLSRLAFPERELYPSPVLPPVITTTVPLPPRRDPSSLKHRRRRHPIDPNDQQKPHQPLLNSSTLDDLFRALTLECEQYLADTSYQNKTYGQMIVQPSSNIQTAVESNDDDYENLHPSPTSQLPLTNSFSPLKTSIQVLSPIKRHVVSITVSSKITSPTKPSPVPTKSIPPSIIHHSSEEDSPNKSSSSTNRKHRRRRARKQFLSSTTTTSTITPTARSSSSSTERKENILEKKPLISKRSCSTDPRYQRHQTSYDNNFISSPSSQNQLPRRPRRRDISLQHPPAHSGRFHENTSSPLSILLTSTKPTSDFLDNSRQRQERRSRLESVNHKSSTLLDRLHQQFYQPSTTRNNNTKNNHILPHRIPSYPVY